MLPLKDTVPSRTFPAINWLLIGLNVLVFIGELSAEAQGRLEGLVQVFGVVPARFLHYLDIQEIGTLFTSMFLHGGWLHLISNMLALYIFGDNVEDRMGHVKYLVFYLLCGAVAGALLVWVSDHGAGGAEPGAARDDRSPRRGLSPHVPVSTNRATSPVGGVHPRPARTIRPPGTRTPAGGSAEVIGHWLTPRSSR